MPAKSQALEVQLRIPKKNYSVGEEIKVTVVLKNISNAPLTINKRMGINPKEMAERYWEVKFDIVYPPVEEEHLIPSTLINRGEPEREDFAVLPPRHKIQETYTLSDYYWMGLIGTYKIRAIYHNADDGKKFGLSAWTGEISSNPIYLKVTK